MSTTAAFVSMLPRVVRAVEGREVRAENVPAPVGAAVSHADLLRIARGQLREGAGNRLDGGDRQVRAHRDERRQDGGGRQTGHAGQRREGIGQDATRFPATLRGRQRQGDAPDRIGLGQDRSHLTAFVELGESPRRAVRGQQRRRRNRRAPRLVRQGEPQRRIHRVLVAVMPVSSPCALRCAVGDGRAWPSTATMFRVICTARRVETGWSACASFWATICTYSAT